MKKSLHCAGFCFEIAEDYWPTYQRKVFGRWKKKNQLIVFLTMFIMSVSLKIFLYLIKQANHQNKLKKYNGWSIHGQYINTSPSIISFLSVRVILTYANRFLETFMIGSLLFPLHSRRYNIFGYKQHHIHVHVIITQFSISQIYQLFSPSKPS